MEEINRRDVLSGAICLASVSGVPVVSGKPDKKGSKPKGSDQLSKGDWRNLRESLVDRYGKPEGVVVYNITKKYLRKSEDPNWEDLKSKIESHPVTNGITKDFRSVEKARVNPGFGFNSTDNDGDVTTMAESGGSTVSMYSTHTWDLYLNSQDTSSQSSGNTRATASVNKSGETLRSVSNAAVMGSGTASARLYSTYKIPESAVYEVSVDYYRNVDTIGNSGGQVSVFTNHDFEGLKRYKLEDLSYGASGHTTRSTKFSLKEGDVYDIGIEVRTRAKASGTVAYTDAYNCIDVGCFTSGRHRVEIDGTPTMRW